MIDEQFERKTLACLMRVHEFSMVASAHLKPSYFDTHIRQNIAKICIDYFKQYRTSITQDAFVMRLKQLFSKGTINPEEKDVYIEEYKKLMGLDIRDWQYILDELIKFVRSKEVKHLVDKTVTDYLPQENFDDLFKEFTRIQQINTANATQAESYRDSVSERTEKRKEALQEFNSGTQTLGIPFGIPKLDKALGYRGLVSKELILVGAPPKTGKTNMLLWCANTAAEHGYNTLFVTLETSIGVLGDRLDALRSGYQINDVLYRYTDVYEEVSSKLPTGDIFFVEYPSKSCTVNDIEYQIRQLQMRQNIKPDLVIVDYLDILKPIRSKNESWQEESDMTVDLRRLAGEQDVAMLSATQGNRSTMNSAVFYGDGVKGSFDKIAHVDGFLTLSGTRQDKEQGRLTMCVSEFRNAPAMAFKLQTNMAFGRFYEDFIEEVY